MGFDALLKSMNRQNFIDYLEGLRKRLDVSVNGDVDLLALINKVLTEMEMGSSVIEPKSIFKVYTVSENKISAPKFYGSLKQAKKDLAGRLKSLKRSPNVAFEEEIVEFGVKDSVAPEVAKPIITNQDFTIKALGRFNFFEVRLMGEDDQITPAQLILIEIRLEDARHLQLNGNAKKKPGLVVKFPG